MGVLLPLLVNLSLLAGATLYNAEGNATEPNYDDDYPALPDCLTVTIEPEQCSYSFRDTITIIVTNRCSDTLYVTPRLQSYHGLDAGWSIIVDDLQRYWEVPDEYVPYESSTLWPVPPQGVRHFRVSMTDVIVSFPNETRMRFQMRAAMPGSLESHDDNYERGSFWSTRVGLEHGKPFMMSEPARDEEHILAALPLKGRKRDTIFTTYDPINHTPVVPPDILVRRPYRLVFVDPFDTMDVKPEHKNRYEIIWPVPSNDGSLELVITKRQIWLRSAHDNPNPNEFFWCIDISEEQYKGIVATVDKAGEDFDKLVPEHGFSRYLYWKEYIPEMPIPEEWTDENRRLIGEDSEKKRYINMKRLIDIFNSGLPSNQKIILPDQDRIPAIQWE